MLDEARKLMVETSSAQVAGLEPQRVAYDVVVENALDDPMVAVMLLRHLRHLLGHPDVGSIRVEIEYEFEDLTRSQLETLFHYLDSSWSGLHIEVTAERRSYEVPPTLPGSEAA
ncbi:MAG TPA: hypothetical protein VF202_06770 [Trueperaceae bacterium]|jgi:hypothetical protein